MYGVIENRKKIEKMKICTTWNFSCAFICLTACVGMFYAVDETVELVSSKNITKITYGHDVSVFMVHTITIAVLFLVVIILTCRTHVLDLQLSEARQAETYSSMNT